ncbi:unnamed protein product, partial [Brenthis ino]
MEDIIDLSEYDDDCVIESVLFTTNNIEKINNYHHIKQENLLFCEILEKCLNLENSTGMLSLINNKLLIDYNRLEKNVKTSRKFETALRKTLDNLNNDPRHKFSHIKFLCNILSELGTEKRRVQLITLDKNVTANMFSKLSCKRPKADQNNFNKCAKKLKSNEDDKETTSSLEYDQSSSIIALDIVNTISEEKGEEGKVIHNGVCNSETNNNSKNVNVADESIELSPSNSVHTEKSNEMGNNNEICLNKIDTLNCQENVSNRETNNDEHKVIEPSKSIEPIPTNSLNNENVKETENDTANDKKMDKLDEHINLSYESASDENRLLVPVKTLEFNLANNLNNMEKIKELENKIAKCKEKIAKLDEQEVRNDSKRSPYMRSEKLKADIVLLYQELCQLTGEHPVRRRQVCIKAMEGHPPGPLKRLETFLNDNIGSDGDPPFPNFREVAKCVLVANKEDNLGWSNAKVMNEARALFTYCGRALQKRRQKREYEDLISKVDTCDDDPADHDPELRAKLEANKQIAIKREMEVFQKFTMMQNQPDKYKDADEEDIYSDSGTDESFPDVNTTDNNDVIEKKDINMKEEKVPETDTNDINTVKIKEEPKESIVDTLKQFGDNFTTSLVDIEGPVFVIDISDSSDEEQS